MAMKPTLFNTYMVRALLENRKTVTRRVVKPQPTGDIHHVADGTVRGYWMDGNCQPYRPPYQPGDICYVPETWKCQFAMLGYDGLGYEVAFRDGKNASFRFESEKRAKKWAKYARKPKEHWQSPYFMPREAARIFLWVTDVRVGRLRSSFTEPICPILELQAEGIDIGETCQQCIDNYGEPCCVDTVDEDGTDEPECGVLDEVRDDFSRLWDSTIKPADRAIYGWAANPWVWVIEFERCEKPEVDP